MSSSYFAYSDMIRHLNFVPLQHRQQPSFSRNDIKFIADTCIHLTKLRVSWMREPFDANVFARFLRNSPNLMSLSGPSCTIEWLTEALIPIINGQCPKLQNLEVKNWVHESSESLLEKIADKCHGIVSLEAPLLVTKEVATMLVKSFPNLKQFKCHSMTRSGLFIFVNGCPNMKSLCLTFDKQLQDITDGSIAEIGEKFPPLESFQLTVGYNENFPRFTLAWAKNQNNLRHLELSLCVGIEDDTFIPITKYCINLESIHLEWCCRLSDNSYIALAHNRNSSLRKLYVFRSGLTDIGLTEIAEYCTRLRKLGLEYCPGVTQVSLLKIIKECKQLVKLSGGFPHKIAAGVGHALTLHGSESLQVLKFKNSLYRDLNRDIINVALQKNYDNIDRMLLEKLSKK
ncbi:6534_t:CDS:1, partial [Scutellospora calospora]